MLPAEGKKKELEEFQSRMLLPPEVAAVIQEITGEPGCHHDPRPLRSARSYARLVRQTMKIGLTAPTFDPFVKKKETASGLIVDCRKANALFAPSATCGAVVWRWLSRVEVGASGLVHGESPACTMGVPMLPTVSTGCVSLWGDSPFFSWPELSNKHLKITEFERTKVSSDQTLCRIVVTDALLQFRAPRCKWASKASVHLQIQSVTCLSQRSRGHNHRQLWRRQPSTKWTKSCQFWCGKRGSDGGGTIDGTNDEVTCSCGRA